MTSFSSRIANANPLQETIARAIFEERYKDRKWDKAKVEDQWLALGAWQEAEAVVKVVPLAMIQYPSPAE